jgi:hypothetical protein
MYCRSAATTTGSGTVDQPNLRSKPGDQHDGQEAQAGQRDDVTLGRILFARTQPAREQFGIAREKKASRQRHRDQEDRKIGPGLPVLVGTDGANSNAGRISTAATIRGSAERANARRN